MQDSRKRKVLVQTSITLRAALDAAFRLAQETEPDKIAISDVRLARMVQKELQKKRCEPHGTKTKNM